VTSEPSPYEQLILELINRARLDPNAEAERTGISLNDGLNPGQISATSKQPLAFNLMLSDAAAVHSSWMLDKDIFSHTGASSSSPADRMVAAGYQFTGSWAWGENIAWNGTTGSLDILAAVLRANSNLFTSPGHRLNILNGSFKEIGLGVEAGVFTSGANYNALMLTEDFAKSGSGNFVTGVAFTDSDNNDLYSVGEGRSTVSISFSEAGSDIGATTTWASGGYALKTTATGNVVVTFADGGLPAPVVVTIALGSANAKVDLIGTDHIESSVTTTFGQNATTLQLLGLNNINGIGNRLNNTITGNASDNVLSGRAGNDTVDGGDGKDLIRGGGGNDSLIGNDGEDTLRGGSGADTLDGGAHSDHLFGGAGNDIVNGGGGKDLLKGGLGADTFQFNRALDSTPNAHRDVIKDFDAAQGDVVDLSHIDANANTARDDGFSIVAAYSHTPGELRITTGGRNSVIHGDINGDGTDDFRILVHGVTDLSAADFVL